MNIIPHVHPAFCDPRACTGDDGSSVEHRDAGLSWRMNRGDHEVTVGIARHDCTDFGGHVGDVEVFLTVVDADLAQSDGSPVAVDYALTSAEARMLAAALVYAAERAAAEQARTVTR